MIREQLLCFFSIFKKKDEVVFWEIVGVRLNPVTAIKGRALLTCLLRSAPVAHAAHLGDWNELRPSFLECRMMALVCHTFSHFAALLLWPGGTDSALETGCYSLPEKETICQQDECRWFGGLRT